MLKPDKQPILFITTPLCSGELTGENVCTKQETFQVAVKVTTEIKYFFLRNIWTSLEPNDIQVQTQQPYQLRTYAWCWAIPPKCSRYKIQMKTVFKTEVVMTFLGSDGFLIAPFLGSDGFLIAPFLGSDGSKDPNSLSVLPRLHNQPQRDHLCSALQVNFFLLIISNFVIVFFLTLLFIGQCWTLWSCSFKWSWSYLWCCSALLFTFY